MIYRWWRGVASVVLIMALVIQQAPVTAALDSAAIEVEGDTVAEMAVDGVLLDNASEIVMETTQELDDIELEQNDVGTTEEVVLVEQSGEEVHPMLLPPMISEVQVSGTCPAGVCSGNNVEFVELYNPNTEPLVPTGMKLRYHGGGVSPTEYDLIDLSDVVLAPSEFAVFGRNMDAVSKKTFTRQLADGAGAIRLVDATGELLDQVAWGGATKSFYGKPAMAPGTDLSIQRCFVDGVLVNAAIRDTSQEFVVYKDELPTPGVGLACPEDSDVNPTDPGVVVNTCEGLRISEVGANLARQFVELQNTLDEPLDAAGCRIMTNRSASAYFALPEMTIEPRGYFVVEIEKTPLTLTKTTTGTVYVLSSDGGMEMDSQSYANLAKETSWALVGDEWKQTYTVTPGATNVYQQYLPCDTGYERNEETGRCRKITQVAELADCGEGRYRSEETGRCRNLTVDSTLQPCAAHQYRNPETNRCRNIATTASTLTPCKPGQERNPAYQPLPIDCYYHIDT